MIIVTVASLHETKILKLCLFVFLAEIHLGDNGVQCFHFIQQASRIQELYMFIKVVNSKNTTKLFDIISLIPV